MSIQAIGIIAALVLTGIALLTLLGFAIRNLFYGKQDLSSILFVAVPLILFVVLGLTGMGWVVAGIWTTFVILALAGLALLISSARGLIGV